MSFWQNSYNSERFKESCSLNADIAVTVKETANITGEY